MAGLDTTSSQLLTACVWLAVGTFSACACRFRSWPEQGARSSALDALFGPGIGLSTKDIFGFKPYILYWVEGKLL